MQKSIVYKIKPSFRITYTPEVNNDCISLIETDYPTGDETYTYLSWQDAKELNAALNDILEGT